MAHRINLEHMEAFFREGSRAGRQNRERVIVIEASQVVETVAARSQWKDHAGVWTGSVGVGSFVTARCFCWRGVLVTGGSRSMSQWVGQMLHSVRGEGDSTAGHNPYGMGRTQAEDARPKEGIGSGGRRCYCVFVVAKGQGSRRNVMIRGR
jgi:hypothetical protein